MSEPCDLTATEARRLIGLARLSPKELLSSCLSRISEVNPAVNAIVAMDEVGAQREAEIADEAVGLGEELGLLHGLPLGIKDLQTTGGLRTTFGSLLFQDNVPDQDEDSVANLRGHGGLVLAKTNTPEFGAGANTRNRVYGATGNPFDPDKTCAGSSGGSAVALATGMVPLATGSDYGGSLRTPAAFCGVCGFRPSPGLVPAADRVVALNPFGVNGPMARTVEDLHLLLRAQLDFDKRDPFSSDDAFAIPDATTLPDLRSLRVAITPDLGCAPVAKDIRDVFAERVATFQSVFGSAEEAAPDLSGVHDIFEVLRGISFVAAHGERLETARDRLGPNVIDNTERGLKFTAAEVARAHAEQTALYRRFFAFFETHDILICPAAAVSPFPHTDWSVTAIDGEEMPTYMRWLALTYALTTALACSVTIPCGVDRDGMPFGIQIAGPNGADAQVLAVALALEKVLAGDDTTRRPVPDLSRLANAPKLATETG
ncbi:MAG: amidase family protein [Pseudomonadota bacterium]